jgi:tetratricopeptide (TPR) repeat protein
MIQFKLLTPRVHEELSFECDATNIPKLLLYATRSNTEIYLFHVTEMALKDPLFHKWLSKKPTLSSTPTINQLYKLVDDTTITPNTLITDDTYTKSIYLQLLSSIPNTSPCYITILVRLMFLYIRLKEYEKAQILLVQLLTNNVQVGTSWLYIILSLLYRILLKYNNSITMLRLVFDMNIDRSLESAVWMWLGELYELIQVPSHTSLTCYIKCLQLVQTGGYHPFVLVPHLYLNMAQLTNRLEYYM